MMGNRLKTLPIWAHGLCALASLGTLAWVQQALAERYLLSKHPSQYRPGAPDFDADRVRTQLTQMQSEDTLDALVTAQLFDFWFMLAIAVFGIAFAGLVARFAKAGTQAASLVAWAVPLVLTGVVFDICENLTSFVIFANPQGAADWLIYLYSGFAVLKFVGLSLAGLVLVAAIVLILRARTRPSL